MHHNFTPFRAFSVITAFLLVFFQVAISRAQAVLVPPNRYQIDAGLKLIVANQIPAFPTGQSLPTIRFDKDYVFTQPISAFETGKAYVVKNGGTDYTLFFTHFPLVKITTAGKQAVSTTDARTKGTFTLANGNDPLFSSSMGVRIRGNASRLFPKKQYNIQLWQDPNGDEERETSLLGLREDSKWLLFAMYNEPLRLQNASAQALWGNLHKLYYQSSEPDANSAIRTKYCDVFLNDSYAGVYMLGEDLDRKQLKLKKTANNGAIRGELYKTAIGNEATTFTALPAKPANPQAEVWAAFEMDYPDPFWDNLYHLLQFAINAPAQEFTAKLSDNFKVDNLIDYYIFLNLTYANDHWGNNQFVARYKENEPYFFIPWDLDAVFGYSPTGKFFEEPRLLNSNSLFNRLLALDPNGFKSKMRKRWFALRQQELSMPTLKNGLAANYNQLTAEGAYTREALKWPSSVYPEQFAAVNHWLENRVAFLDEYFALFPEEPNGIQLTYFQGESISGGKKLKWAFRANTTARKVEVQHSSNGVSFNTVGTVGVSNPTAASLHEFTHAKTDPHTYYRLKIFTGNDAFTYSAFISLGSNTCPNAPAPPSIRASIADVPGGESVVLTASGCAQTIIWNTGQTGSVVVVNPTETTAYSARCRLDAGCESVPSATATVQVYPPNSLPGSFEGYLGAVDCSFIRGWAWDRNKPNAPIYIDILDGQKVIGTTIAGIFRQDLKDAQKGNGSHSYLFAAPEGLKDNVGHQISARVHGTTFVLRDSPKKLTCAGSFTAPAGNQSPVAPAVASLTAVANTPFSTTLPAFTDPDSPTLTYGLSSLPAGLNFTGSTRTISGTPTNTGISSLTYSASDGVNTTSITVLLTVESASIPGVSGNFEGYLDKVECETIRGWVWDRDKPNQAFTVEFFAQGQSIGTARADIFRQDLKDAQKGNGYHVYSFTTPVSVKTGQAVEISAKVQNSAYFLKQSPRSLTCPATSTNQPPQPPVSVTPLSATVNAAFTATLPPFTDADSPSLTYALAGLPGSLSFTAGTQTISGTPTATAALSLTYSASDGTLTSSLIVPLTISGPLTPPVSITGNFEGYLDKVECGTIRGWVWDRDKPNEAFTVEFFANGNPIGTVRADIFRQDLKDAGKGNGNHVYNFTTPVSVKTGQTFQISARVQNSPYTLAWSPKPLNCAPNSRLSASAGNAETDLLVTPNPTTGEFEVQFRKTSPAAAELSVVDAVGRVWFRKTVEGAGYHHEKVRLVNAGGTFQILLQEDQQIRSRKVLIGR
ncbi:CotH kinase family protein [Larkinella rosea]|uniref:Dystroglycan-type cadherin-like domain-containing protein n=1 Tax=Larkinella rosea TaxID=2025312 RepID=A0A3P1B9K0_9BACT|nr:CotH kinase family protein [Larkinella rosea]RRA97735.1 hypothetical protein EHT25_32335 [Larkinella rosea]